MVFLNEGDGQLGKPAKYESPLIQALAAGDFDRDGDLDLAGTGGLNQTILPFPCGAGDFGEAGNQALMDFNGDGGPDLSDTIGMFTRLFLGGPPHVLGSGCAEIADCADNSKKCPP